jgi:VanZ family protein
MVRLVCALVLSGILCLGLWPFHRPKNAVTWVGNRDGLEFGDYGIVRSSGIFESSPDQVSSSLEIWFQPGLTSDSNTFLAFSTAENPLQFSMHQYLSSLILRHENHNGRNQTEISLSDVFRQGRPVFLTITSGARGTTMYIDGQLANTYPRFRLADDLTGQLEIGTSPVVTDAWQGVLRGVAVYYRELTDAQVRRHYETWMKYIGPEVSRDQRLVALYLFNERAGDIVHNAARVGIDLDIPKRYSLLHQTRFEPFWKEYRPVSEHWMDILMNIVGFIPLGFAFCAYWAATRSVRSALLLVTCLGFLVSFTIEFFQSYLPTRHSGTTDLITNTLGTFFGAKLWATNDFRTSVVKISRFLLSAARPRA